MGLWKRAAESTPPGNLRNLNGEFGSDARFPELGDEAADR